MGTEDTGFWITLAVMAIGLVGSLVPGMPGASLIWAAALVYALASGFAGVHPLALGVLTVLGIAGATSGIWMGHAGARAGGASRLAGLAALAGGLVGMGVGLLFFGIGAVPGAIVGSLAGIVLVEYRRRKQWEGALRASAGWLAGYLVAALVEFVICCAMIGIFVAQALLP